MADTDRPSAEAGPAPLVSVVIPTYRRWPLIAESVQSVLDQTFRDFELIVIDDDSPDGTAEHLREKFPSVRVLDQNPPRPASPPAASGPTAVRTGLGRRGAARNQGIREARGRFVAFLDDDDLYEPWHLAQFAEARRAHPDHQVFASAGWLWDPESGRKQLVGLFDPKTIAKTSLLGNAFPQVVLVASRSALLDVGGYPEEAVYDGSEDWYLLMRLVNRHPVCRLPRPSVRIRLHPGRSMNDPTCMIESREAVTKVVTEEGLLGQPLDEESRRLMQAATHRFAAGHLYVAGDMKAARARLRQVHQTLGLRRGVPWTAKLWLETWMGPAGSAAARRLKQQLLWRR